MVWLGRHHGDDDGGWVGGRGYGLLQEAEAKDEARREKLHTRQRDFQITFDIAGRRVMVEGQQQDDPRAMPQSSVGGSDGGTDSSSSGRQPSALAQGGLGAKPPSSSSSLPQDMRIYANDTLTGRAQEVSPTKVEGGWHGKGLAIVGRCRWLGSGIILVRTIHLFCNISQTSI